MSNLDYDADLCPGEQRQLQDALCSLAYQPLKLFVRRSCTLKLIQHSVRCFRRQAYAGRQNQPAILLRGLNTTSTMARSSFSSRACAPCGPYTAAITAVPSCDQCADPSARSSMPRAQLMLLQQAEMRFKYWPCTLVCVSEVEIPARLGSRAGPCHAEAWERLTSGDPWSSAQDRRQYLAVRPVSWCCKQPDALRLLVNQVLFNRQKSAATMMFICRKTHSPDRGGLSIRPS